MFCDYLAIQNPSKLWTPLGLHCPRELISSHAGSSWSSCIAMATELTIFSLLAAPHDRQTWQTRGSWKIVFDNAKYKLLRTQYPRDAKVSCQRFSGQIQDISLLSQPSELCLNLFILLNSKFKLNIKEILLIISKKYCVIFRIKLSWSNTGKLTIGWP